MTDPSENVRLLTENRLYTSQLTRQAMERPNSLEANQIVFLAECYERAMVVVAALAERDAEIERLRRLCGDATDFVRFSKAESIEIENESGVREVFVDDVAEALHREFAALSVRPPSE